MAVTVVKYPQGQIIDDTVEYNAQIVLTYAPSAAVYYVGHGLSTGNYVYIRSNYAQYNGYWYISKIDNDYFYIREYATASNVTSIASANITYYKSLSPNPWNCVHLPIIYKLKSDLWPINGVDTARTITTFTNWNGYTYLVLNGDLKSTGTASSLENIVLSGVTGVDGTTITGVYRIIQWFSETNIVIDLIYNAGHVLSGGTCQYYYLNYHAKVKVYAGLVGTHYWAAVKPYEEIAEVKVTFDSTGIGVLNVADFVKEKIEAFSNNLQLDTLPNNLDAWCRIKLSIAESYDDSDGYTIEEYTSSYTDDTTEIYAVNAKLPFKTRSGGMLDQYVYGGTVATVQKFLTPFTQPTLFDGYYFDLSWVHNTNSISPNLKIDRYEYTNGNYVLSSSAITTITDMDQGVYRYPITRTGTEDRIDITLVTLFSVAGLSSFSNQGSGETWTTGATPSITTSASGVSKYLAGVFSGYVGLSVIFTIDLTFTGGFVEFTFLDSSFSPIGSLYPLVSGSQNETVTVPSGASYFAFIATGGGPGSAADPTINSLSVSPTISSISETLTIDVVDDCNQFRTTNMYLTWLNYLGGYDYWLFTAQKLFSVDITENKTQTVNIYNDWPNSYGEFAQSIEKQSVRGSRNVVKVTSQYLTKDQMDALAWIVSSPLVQIMSIDTVNGVTIPTQRTVLVDTSTLKKYQDRDNLYSISFNISYTDELPAQTL